MGVEFYRAKISKARKNHTCNLCNKTIYKDTQYLYEVGKYDGELFVNHLCISCKNIRSRYMELYRDDVSTSGYTWEEINTDIYEKVCSNCDTNDKGACPYMLHELAQCDVVQEIYTNIKVV